ncbi:MAG: YidH family protein [Croceibacterium sp.]
MADIEKRAVKAEEKLADSADTLVDSAESQEDSAERRTRLAADRTLLAAERTYAAWMRTGLASLAAGIGAKALLQDLVADWLVLATSIVLITFSEFCFVAGIWRELTGKALRPDPDTARLPGWILLLFNGFLIVVGFAVLIGIVSR